MWYPSPKTREAIKLLATVYHQNLPIYYSLFSLCTAEGFFIIIIYIILYLHILELGPVLEDGEHKFPLVKSKGELAEALSLMPMMKSLAKERPHGCITIEFELASNRMTNKPTMYQLLSWQETFGRDASRDEKLINMLSRVTYLEKSDVSKFFSTTMEALTGLCCDESVGSDVQNAACKALIFVLSEFLHERSETMYRIMLDVYLDKCVRSWKESQLWKILARYVMSVCQECDSKLVMATFRALEYILRLMV